MDFTDTPEEAAYRAKARAWLEANAHQMPEVADTRRGSPGAAHLAGARVWQALKADAGYAQITWPKEWGGAGGTPIDAVIFAQEEARIGQAPGYFEIGLGMCVPTVMAFADAATKQRFVRPALRGEEIWCQLFSEPGAGSDVASARTAAVRAGDDWIVNGQKVWTSGAHLSNFGILLVRTDPNVPKHKGMTMFWVDMKSPGIEVRPIHQMSGGSNFNEVFFTDVRIPDSQRLGAVGNGWKVSLVTLMNERLAIGGAMPLDHKAILQLARSLPTEDGGSLADDGAFRERLADWYVQSEGLKYTRFRAMTALSRGQTPGPENSIGKIVAAQQYQDLANIGLELEDQYGVIADRSLAPLAAAFQTAVIGSPAVRIAGGTDEILRNIIAERVLGLPGDVRVDKDVPFKDMPTGQ